MDLYSRLSAALAIFLCALGVQAQDIGGTTDWLQKSQNGADIPNAALFRTNIGAGMGGGSVTSITCGSGLSCSVNPIIIAGTVDLKNSAAVLHQFYTSVVGNVLVGSRPACVDLSDSGTACQAASSSFFAVANNLSEGTASTMRTNLGLVIGTNVEAWSAALDTFASNGSAYYLNGSHINAGVVGSSYGGAGAITGALKANGSGTVSQAACADLSNASASCSTDATNASNLNAGTVASARGGAGSINGALKGNGSGVVSQAACGDLSNAAASCSTDATNAANIGSGTLPTGRMPALTGDTITSANAVATTTTKVSGPVAANTQINAPTNYNVQFGSGTYCAPDSYSPGSGGTATLDLSKCNYKVITMPAGNITIAISNATTGDLFVVDVVEDSVGSRTLTYFTTIKWPAAAAMSTSGANKTDTFGCRVTGSNTYNCYIVGQNL